MRKTIRRPSRDSSALLMSALNASASWVKRLRISMRIASLVDAPVLKDEVTRENSLSSPGIPPLSSALASVPTPASVNISLTRVLLANHSWMGLRDAFGTSMPLSLSSWSRRSAIAISTSL